MSSDQERRYNSLIQKRNRNEREQSNTRNNINRIDDEIRRLREAYNKIDQEKEAIKNQKKNVARLRKQYNGSWKGQHAETVYASCDKKGSLGGQYQAYIDRVDAIEDAINYRIRDLKNERSGQWGILQGLISAWNNLSAEIRNFFN